MQAWLSIPEREKPKIHKKSIKIVMHIKKHGYLPNE